ncbi:MAG: hypothetical protein K8T89_14470 [Planctomycetes bacterium]|nr:hypothetical protein [Planctomycetota bacterium]
MRFAFTLFTSLTLLGLSTGRCIAQNRAVPDIEKRQAEIQKEIEDLQRRIKVLQAELGGHRGGGLFTKGIIQELIFNGVVLDRAEGLCYVANKNTQIIYSDGEKATTADLKIGKRVSVWANDNLRALSNPAQAAAFTIIIEKEKPVIAREIPVGRDADEIFKHVDFAKEYLAFCRMEDDAGGSKFSFKVSSDKDGPIVDITYHRSSAKGPDGHVTTNIFVIAKNARITGHQGVVKKITSVEELAKALQGTK